jgi:hypothetical protein
LSFHADIAGETYGIHLPSTTSDWAVYRDFLGNVLPELLQDVDLQIRINLRFMHDGAPPNCLLAGWEFLNNVFPKQWIGRDGQAAWPSHSRLPDLSLYISISGDLQSLLFMLLKSVPFRTCNNEHRTDLIRFVRHLEFYSESGNHCSDVHRPLLKLKVDTEYFV